jgi:hypothetical protein
LRTETKPVKGSPLPAGFVSSRLPPCRQHHEGRHPAFIAYDLSQMIAVLAVAARHGRAVRVLSPPGAAASWGAEVFAAMTAAAARAVPAADATFILDCGDAPGHALAAIGAGIRHLRINATALAQARLEDLARQAGVAIDRGDASDALDLFRCENVPQEATEWLGHARK